MAASAGMFARVGGAQPRAGTDQRTGTRAPLIVCTRLALVVAVLLWIATAASAALAVLAAREWTWGCVSDPLTAGLVPLVHSSGTVLPHADVGSGPTTDDAWVSSTPFAFSIMLLIAGGLCWPSDRLGPTADEGKRTHDELPHVSRKDEAGCHGPRAAVVVEAVAGKMDFCNRL